MSDTTSVCPPCEVCGGESMTEVADLRELEPNGGPIDFFARHEVESRHHFCTNHTRAAIVQRFFATPADEFAWIIEHRKTRP